MGQKVNPHGLRVGVIKDWDSRWYAKKSDIGDLIVQDYKIRGFVKNKLFAAGISRIEIERGPARIRVHIHCAKPGIVIGRGGTEIEKLKVELEKLAGQIVNVNIVEIRNPDMISQLVAENIAAQLERRISYRRAMKQAMGRAMKLGAKGIKTRVSGRLGGAEIARNESYHEGTIPLQTLRADIDYGTAEANTTYGIIGVKVWIYKGELLKGEISNEPPPERKRDRRPPGGKRPGNNNRGDRRPASAGDNNRGDRRPAAAGDRNRPPHKPQPKEGGAK